MALRIAVEGCGHGTLDEIYASVEESRKAKGWDNVDCLIICGDFQAVRNAQDLNVVAMPAKYRRMADFHKYYSGAQKAPYLTIFLGGNHEASNYLIELYYGGWVAPNIYYLGAANVVRLGSLRIAALSGIWKGYNYRKSHFERLPYSEDDMRSIYHVRELDTRKLLQIRTQVDVGLSHDWPKGIEWKGDWKRLFRKKKHFEDDARNGSLGSVAANQVLWKLRPAYWFSAHLHVKYAAFLDFDHEPPIANPLPSVVRPATQPMAKNPDEIDIDLDNDDEDQGGAAVEGDPQGEDARKVSQVDADGFNGDVALSGAKPQVLDEQVDIDQNVPRGGKRNGRLNETGSAIPKAINARLPTHSKTLARLPEQTWNTKSRFLSLDKCLPNRDYIQLLDIEPLKKNEGEEQVKRPLNLQYDKEWLAIVRVFADELTWGDQSQPVVPDKGEQFYRQLIDKQETWVEENLVQKGKMDVPPNFATTAPPFDPNQHINNGEQPREYSNPQTRAFCELLQIANPFDVTDDEALQRAEAGKNIVHSSDGGMYRGNNQRGRGRGRGRGSVGRYRGR
ncbi:MAG: hypothetical protein M1821_000361 [Bathelium mastoideum]|nr:MAG: hypothetical protein M1821_000361 [Bathelium mastoideum]KAI9686170.1 MAG: hypothetical protein M1822_003825 [Bathelium mastoideum]